MSTLSSASYPCLAWRSSKVGRRRIWQRPVLLTLLVFALLMAVAAGVVYHYLGSWLILPLI
jgi:hypothetical protein